MDGVRSIQLGVVGSVNLFLISEYRYFGSLSPSLPLEIKEIRPYNSGVGSRH